MFITYMNVYSNPSTKLDVIEKVKIGQGEKQNKIEKGDILFTGSSETPDECGMSSVVTDDITSDYYLNSFCFGFRLNNKDTFEPNFLKHLFRDLKMRAQIARTANGVTRYNVSKKLFARIIIPVPPLPVQREIVRILDSFTSLEAELEAELEARRKQYEYYRDQLLSFKHLSGGGREEVEWKTLPQISQNLDSKRKPIKSSRRVAGMYPYYGASGIVDYVEDYIFDGDFLLVSEDGANLLARTSKIAFSISGKNWVNNHAHVLSFNDAVRRKFVEFYIENLDLSRYISAGAQPKLTKDKLNSIPIPQPPYEKQQEIVSILDRFESLVNDITTGLPAEIAARHQQYEYYRDQLLSFKRKS